MYANVYEYVFSSPNSVALIFKIIQDIGHHHRRLRGAGLEQHYCESNTISQFNEPLNRYSGEFLLLQCDLVRR
jgi:hypothetical protein